MKKFLHLRNLKASSEPETKGGVTFAYKVHDNGDVEVAIAKCHNKDNFCRRIGRLISEGRFNKGHTEILGNVNDLDNKKLKEFIIESYMKYYF